MTNFSCSSGVHLSRDLDAAASDVLVDEEGFGLLGLPVEIAPVEPTEEKSTMTC